MRRAILAVLLAAGLTGAVQARELTSVYVITAAANTQGKLGTDWHTDVTLYNPHQYSLPVVMHFLPSGQPNDGPVPTTDFELAPWETLNLWDVLGPHGFDARGHTGALLVYADKQRTRCDGTDCDFALFSRTYTLDPQGRDGEFGQAFPGFPANLGVDSSVIAYLPQLLDDAGFRTNLGVVSWTGDWVTVRVDLQDEAGDIVDSRDHVVPPFGHLQWHVEHGIEGGTAAVYVVAGPGDAMVYPYASVVNNVYGDAVTVEAQITPVGLTAQSASPVRRRAPRAEPERGAAPHFSVEFFRAHPRR
jgi:hypothetical protein